MNRREVTCARREDHLTPKQNILLWKMTQNFLIKDQKKIKEYPQLETSCSSRMQSNCRKSPEIQVEKKKKEEKPKSKVPFTKDM